LSQYEIELQPITPPEARKILQARLQPYQEAFHAVEPVWKMVQKDLLFPLGESWAQSVLTDKLELRPRDVINWAREGWRREQAALQLQGSAGWLATWPHAPSIQPPAPIQIEKRIDEAIALKVHEHTQQKLLEPQSLPPDADNLVGLLHTLLQRCLKAPPFLTLSAVERLKAPKYGKPASCQLLVRRRSGDGREVHTGVLCLVVSDKKSMAAFLRRLVDDPQCPERLLLVIDERRPLDLAAGGREYLDTLRNRHQDRFQQINLSFAAYAELDSLQAVIGLARSGDLEIESPGGNSRSVTEKEVIESHLRQQRYLAHPLLKTLLTGEGPLPAMAKSPSPVDTAHSGASVPQEQDLRQFIMGRLAITMGISSHELAMHYQSYLKIARQVDLTLTLCKTRLEEAARKLHQEGKINATPHDDYLYLLLK
jgi:hypothetical protein